jgi:hypothetical protein
MKFIWPQEIEHTLGQKTAIKWGHQSYNFKELELTNNLNGIGRELQCLAENMDRLQPGFHSAKTLG